MMRIAAALGLAAALAACGTVAPLTPPQGARAPEAPYGATDKPSAEELLRREALAAPERSVELRRRSEERQDDPFDLPPE
jgi:predicted small lipoprotein YifL